MFDVLGDQGEDQQEDEEEEQQEEPVKLAPESKASSTEYVVLPIWCIPPCPVDNLADTIQT